METLLLSFCFAKGVELVYGDTGSFSTTRADNLKYTVYHLRINCNPKYYNNVLWF